MTENDNDAMRSHAARARMLFVFSHAPHGGAQGREGLDTVLMAAAFEQPVTLIFVDDGIFQLVAGQDTIAAGLRNHAPGFAALPMYDVERILVDRHSLALRGLCEADLMLSVELMDSDELAAEIENHDVLFGY